VRHAIVVVLGVVDRVDTDGVDTEVDELLNVALAAFGVSNGVLVCGRTAWLVVDAADVEAVAVGSVKG
jgi:energy-converting hydrogenase Eha subunit E